LTEEVDTGFGDVLAGEKWVEAPLADPVTVAVTIPASGDEISPPNLVTELTPDGIQAAKSLVHLPDLSASQLARLARDFAMDIKERHVILQDNKLTEAQYDFIESHNTFYKAALHAACIEWHAPLSTQERIKVEAAAILEDSLIGLGVRMQSKSEGLPGVVEVAKLFAKVAGVGEREGNQTAPGERFVINIDLGGGQKITASASPAPAKIETSAFGPDVSDE
jgi:hypothetical protein